MFSLFRSVGIVTWAWRSVLSCSFNPRIWLPFLIIAAVQFVTLGLLVSFHRPVLSEFLPPLITAIGGEGAVHYPFFFWVLPLVYSRVATFVVVIVGSLAVGAATLHFARVFGHEPAESPWRLAARRYPTLLVLSGLMALLLYGFSELRSTAVPLSMMQGSTMVRWGVRFGMLGLFILVQSFLVYGAAWVLIRGDRLFPAIGNSLRMCGRTFLPTVFLVGVPAMIQFPVSFLINQASTFGEKFRPEVVEALVAAGIGLELLLGFFLVGSITRVFLLRLEEKS